MTRLRIAVPSLALLLVALACAEERTPDEEAAVDTQAAAGEGMAAAADKHPTCNQPSNKTPTRRLVIISLEDDNIVADPDTVIQRVAAGAIRWRMDSAFMDHGWEVEFKNGDSPLPQTVYFDSSGGTAGGQVKGVTPCKYYSYAITVWPQSDPSNTTVLDPGADIIP